MLRSSCLVANTLLTSNSRYIAVLWQIPLPQFYSVDLSGNMEGRIEMTNFYGSKERLYAIGMSTSIAVSI